MSFSKFISQYENPNRKRINEELIYGMRNEPLVDYILDAFKSLEVINNIKMLDYDYIEHESQFDTDVVNEKYLKSKKSKGKNIKKHINIDVTRYNMLRVNFKLTLNNEVQYKQVELLLLKQYKKYYLMMSGNKFYPIYQIVDSSTYNNKDYVTLKTMYMPIIIKRNTGKLNSIAGDSFQVPHYTLCIFKKKCNAVLYYLATMGLENTLRFMNVEDAIDVVAEPNWDDEEHHYFKCNHVYVKVVKYLFDNDHFVQSMVYALHELCKKTEFHQLEDVDYWVTSLGAEFAKNTNGQLEKGKNVLLSFYRLLDNTTRKSLKLQPFNKENIYALIRWLLCNFSELKAKDNMDLANKRIRMAEYIAFYFIRKLSTKVNMLLSRKRNAVTMADLVGLLTFPPDELIKQLHKSKSSLLRYDNTVNDMDFFTALKYSTKGPGSLGEHSSNAVNIKYRGVHPSHVGRLDINTSGSSDPGMGGVFTPFMENFGMYFDDTPEPDNWLTNYKKLYANHFEGKQYEIKGLDYFYQQEKKSRKMVERLEDVHYFIRNDEYNKGYNILDVDDKLRIAKVVRVDPARVKTKPKARKVKATRLED